MPLKCLHIYDEGFENNVLFGTLVRNPVTLQDFKYN